MLQIFYTSSSKIKSITSWTTTSYHLLWGRQVVATRITWSIPGFIFWQLLKYRICGHSENGADLQIWFRHGDERLAAICSFFQAFQSEHHTRWRTAMFIGVPVTKGIDVATSCCDLRTFFLFKFMRFDDLKSLWVEYQNLPWHGEAQFFL